MSKFDKNIKKGDLITAYIPGFHIVTKVERRFLTKDLIRAGYDGKVKDEFSALIHTRIVMDSDGQPCKGSYYGRTWVCDSEYCEKIDKKSIKSQMNKEISEVRARYVNLLKYL